MYFDLDVRCEDIGEMLQFSKKLGWKGMCFVLSDIEKLKGLRERGRLGDNEAIGIEISGKDHKEIINRAREIRKNVEIIIAYSPNLEISRAALEVREIDVLRQEAGLGFSPVLAKLAAENNVALDFRFSDLLHSHKRARANVFRGYMEAARMLRKFSAPFIITSGAEAKWDLRSPFDLMAFGRLLGFRDPEISRAMSGSIIRENRKRLSGKWIMPGIEVE